MTFNNHYKQDVIMVTDLETTGLHPDSCYPLEVGISIMVNDIDADEPTLKQIDSLTLMVCSQETVMWAKDTLLLDQADRDVAQQMHMDNGLIADLLGARNSDPSIIFLSSFDEADEVLRDWLITRDLNGYPLVGASVGSLDRPFIQHFFPEFNETLSYRNVDTSSLAESIKLFDAQWGESLRDSAFESIGVTETAHRTLDDCRNAARALVWTMKHLDLF